MISTIRILECELITIINKQPAYSRKTIQKVTASILALLHGVHVTRDGEPGMAHGCAELGPICAAKPAR